MTALSWVGTERKEYKRPSIRVQPGTIRIEGEERPVNEMLAENPHAI